MADTVEHADLADTGREQLVKAHEIVVANVSEGGETTQDSVTVEDSTGLPTPDNAIEPPMALEQLAALTEQSSTRSSCLQAITTNTVGLGYDLDVVNRRLAPDKPDEALAELRGKLEALARRDTRRDRPSFTSLLAAAKWDEEEIGQGYIEAARDRTTGQISGLYHVPAKRVRRLKSRKGYVLLPEDGSFTGTPFYNFGEKVRYDQEGNPQNKLAEGSTGFPRRWATNEILAFKLHTSRSRDYGLPRDAGSVYEYLIDRLATQTNVAFFGSGGTPPHVIFVQGEEQREGERITFRVPEQTNLKIAQTLQGQKAASRVAIIPLPPGTKVEDVQLGEVSDRDVGFVEIRGDNRRRVLTAFRISPIFIADTEDAGRYTAEVERAITHEQVFDPEQNRYEDRLHITLLRDLGYPWAGISFRELAIEGNAVRRESATRLAEAGTILRSEHREAFGLKPIPEAKPAADGAEPIEWDGQEWQSEEPEPGQVPYGWNSELVNTGVPRGAENRNPESDQRGLRPGIGGREPRGDDPPSQVQAAAAEGATGVGQALHRSATRATRRARRSRNGAGAE